MHVASPIRRLADPDDLTAPRLSRRTVVRGGFGLATLSGLGASVLPAERAGAQAKPGGTVTIGAVVGNQPEGFDPHNSFGNLTSDNPGTSWQEAEGAADLLPRGVFHLLGDCAHWPQYEQAEEWWQVEVWYKTQRLTLSIIFPKDRHCRRAWRCRHARAA